ncbi:MAG TPA: helix-turn-helix transcriptional regulator [Thermoanaerobaculia bacterium]|nr:helix-turn-helix transcriptional regulator [Thermoanaerobaculia bacterium]
MPDEEIERLRKALQALVEGSGRSQRDIERELELGHGYLNHLFSGRMELKFKHVLLLGRALGFTPSEFFRRAYPPVSHAPDWPAQEIEGAFAETGVPLRRPTAGLALDPDGLKELVREILTELLLEIGSRPHGRERRRGGKQVQRSRKPGN